MFCCLGKYTYRATCGNQSLFGIQLWKPGLSQNKKREDERKTESSFRSLWRKDADLNQPLKHWECEFYKLIPRPHRSAAHENTSTRLQEKQTS